MKKKRLCMVLLVALVMFTINVKEVRANALDDATASIKGQMSKATFGYYGSVNGIRISVLDSTGKSLKSGTTTVDILYGASGNVVTTNQKMTKLQYLANGTTPTWGKSTYAYSINSFSHKFDEFLFSGKINGNANMTMELFLKGNYLNGRYDYAPLREYVAKTGYKCLSDSSASGCSSNDLISVEILFNSTKTKHVGTFYEFLKSGEIHNSKDCTEQKKICYNSVVSSVDGSGLFGDLQVELAKMAANLVCYDDEFMHSTNACKSEKDWYMGYMGNISENASKGLYTKTSATYVPSALSTIDLIGNESKSQMINYLGSNKAVSIGVYRLSDVLPNYKLTIKKYRRDGKTPISGIEFKITGGDKVYVGTTDSNGNVVFSLPAGKTYNIIESNSGKYMNISMYYNENSRRVTMDSDKTISYNNLTECEYDFQTIVGNDYKNMGKRIKVYRKRTNNMNYNNLLNLNITDATAACTHKACGQLPSVTKCLSSAASPDNSNYMTDLSCYNDVLKINGKRESAYCITNFLLSNSLGTTSFKSKSGQLLINNGTNPLLATGSLVSSCYVFDTGSKYTSSYVSDVNFSYKGENYVQNKDEKLVFDDQVSTNGFKQFKKVFNYNFKPIYLSIGTGRIYFEKGKNLRFIGYGIPSKLNDKTDSGKLYFSLGYSYMYHDKNSSHMVGPYKGSATCDYEVEREVVSCDPNDKDCNEDTPSEKDQEVLNVEFRIISPTNSFPGKSGNGRKVGANWCDEGNCYVKNNSIIKTYIIDKNDSNNSKGEEAKYHIELNSKNIQSIREYNKNHNYDDYDTLKNCDESGNGCKSKFLSDYFGI